MLVFLQSTRKYPYLDFVKTIQRRIESNFSILGENLIYSIKKAFMTIQLFYSESKRINTQSTLVKTSIFP